MTLDLPYPWLEDEALQANFDRIKTQWPSSASGKATIASGTATVLTSRVTAASRIFLTAQSLGTVTVPKALAVTARTDGVSFTITSADATDTSVVAWHLVDPGGS